MKTLVLTTLILFSFNLSAQSLLKNRPLEANPPHKENYEVFSFQVDNECHVGVSGVEADSELRFLSNNNGGKVLKTTTATIHGDYYDVFKKSEMPAFASNNGFVEFFDEHEFKLKNIKLNDNSSSFSVSFDGVANHEDNVEYAIYLVDRNGLETLLKETSASLNENWESIEFFIDKQVNANYLLKVSSNNTVRYTKTLFLDGIDNAYTIYPTFTSGKINIDFVAEIEQGEYTITNTNGQIVDKGVFESQLNTIEVAKLESGNYFIRVMANSKQLPPTSFIKH